MSTSKVQTHAAPPRLRFRVPSEPSHLRRARERIRDYLRQYSAERELIDDLVLCVEEAATNAIRHSGADADIEIALEFDGDSLVALVKDQGRGFDLQSFRPERVPDPNKDHGRGLFIIAALMDSLELRADDGLEVRMTRKTEARPGSAALDTGLGELSVGGDGRRTSGALERREARTRALLDEIDEAFVALDWEYRYVHANRVAVHLLERPLPELLGRTPWELFPQLDDGPLGARFRDAMELGKPSVSDHRSLVSGDWLEVRVYPTSVGVSIYYREIATRKRTELERETTIDFLRLINESETLVALADAATAFFGRQSGCEAVGLRLRDGDDYPYFTTHGLPPEFVALERSLIARDAKGQVCRDAAGHATLECLCGDVVGGRLDPSADYATARGSFWSNDTTQLLATIDQDARQAPLRGRCMSEGYQSVALVGLRVGEERLGLLQLNDRRKGCFAPEDIELWERLADQLAIAISKLRLEEELHDSRGRERFLAEVVEDAAAPFGVGSPDGRLLFFNQAFADLTGYSRQELESKAITWAVDLTPKRWRKPEAAQLADAVRHRRPVRYEKEYRRKDGRLVPVEAFVQPVFDASGTLVHYRSFMTDISRRKATQQERRRAELDRQRLFEDSQTQAEELRTQGEELRLQNDELVAQRDAIARESELRAGLNAISALLHSTLETDEVLRLTLREATRVLGVDGAAIELRAGDAWPVRYAHGLPDDALGRPLIDEALIARLVAGTGEPLVSDDVADHADIGPAATLRGIRSLVAVPLLERERAVGVLILFAHRTPRHFEAAEVDFAKRLATTVGLAIENARLFAAAVEAQLAAGLELRGTELLLEAATVLSSWTDLDRMLQSLGDLLARSAAHSRIVLELWDEERREVEIAVSRGAEAIAKQRFGFDEISAATRQAITTRHKLVIDYDATTTPDPMSDYIKEHGFRLLLAVPIVYRERLVGLIMVDEPGERRPFGSQEMQLIEAIAAQAGAAIENARLFEAELVAREAESQRVARLSVLKDVADSASSSLNVHTVAASVVGAVHRLLDARQVQVRLVSGDRSTLEAVAGAGLPRGFLDKLGPIATDSDVETAVCFRTGQPRLGENIDALAVSAGSRRHARDAGVRSYALLPLLARGEAIGIFYVAWAQPRRFGAEELSFLQAVAAQAATGLENARLYEAARLAQEQVRHELDRTTLLQKVTTAATSSLSLPEIGARVLAIGTQALAASSGAIFVVDEAHEALRAIALAGYPDDTAREVAVLSFAEPSSVSRLVVRDLPLVTHDSGLVGAASTRRAGRLSAAGQRWFALPIKRGGVTLGVFGFAFDGLRPFADDELALYGSIAELLGAAFDNARVFDQQRRIATTLQENFIHESPEVRGLELGVVSQPAYEPDRVGGDFSDIFQLDDTRVAVLIGDVAGKGIRAAGMTETVRSKIQAFASIDPSPAVVLARTNELLMRLDPDEPHVTAFFTVLDAATGQLSYASAGHPAPVHLGASTCRALPMSYGPPLGSFAGPYENAHAMLTIKDYLVLYTDGVTEARRGGELLGERRLLEIVDTLRGRSAQGVAEGVRDAALEFAGRLSDDLQVVVLRLG